DRGRPDDAVLVVVLFDRGRHHAARADPVRAHDKWLLGAVLVEEARLERLGVLGLQLEDVSDLDRHLEEKLPTAVRAGITFLRLTEVGETRLEVPTGLDPAEMPPRP